MPNQRKRILIFDEDYESMVDLKEHLEEEGYEVALTAQANLPQRLGSERFDLVLVDIMIHSTSPDAEGRTVDNIHFDGTPWHQTGLEFLQALRQGEFSSADNAGTSPDVPIIVLSAVASDSITPELRDRGLAQYYMTKPYRFKDILSRIDALLKG